MRIPLFIALFLAACAIGPVGATQQSVISDLDVGPGSPHRRAVLDALRPAVERRVGPNVEFVVREIRVIDGWAFVAATPQRRGGQPIDGRRYFPQFDAMGGIDVTALLRLRGGRWRLVEHAIGATDVWYCDRGPVGLTPRCDGR